VRLASRINNLEPYVFETLGHRIAALRAQGHNIVDLGISDPDLPPNSEVIARLAGEARRPAAHRYPPYAGTRALRQAVADWYQERFQVSLDPEHEILITLGSKESLVHLALAVVNPGDVVLAPDPGYPAYAMAGALFGAETHYLSLRPEHGFLPRLDEVPDQVRERARLLYLNYPNNPTGRVAPPGAWAEWARWCQPQGTVLVSDLAYADIVFEGRAASVLEVPEARDLAVESLTWSKGHSMQGWRVGALAGSHQIIEAVRRVESNINAGVFLPIQAAAETALREDHPEALRDRYRRRRDLAVTMLRAAGFRLVTPEAAVYCWVAAPDGDGDRLAEEALGAGVAVTPGRAFGPSSRDHVRISLTHSRAELQEGLERLARVAALL
jgi:LL-diaminopimelate aminotransferase